MISNIDVSIIICCYNSENLIEETLRHILEQKTPKDFLYQIILVDNNSNDNTSEVASVFWEKSNSRFPLKIIKEPKPGLGHARKTGVLESESDLLLFCDDDNLLDENYLSLAFSFMKENLDVGAIGGKSIGVLETDTPIWWRQEADSFAVGEQAKFSGDVSKRGYLWGAGLVIRKSIMLELFQAGFTSLLLGRTGEKLTSGDDSEICKWVLILKHKLWYLDSLHFKHYITKNRLTEDYLLRMKMGHEDALVILNSYDWFINNKLRFEVNRGFFVYLKYSFKLILNGILFRDEKWRENLQLLAGSSIKIHPHIFKINRIYNKVKKNINSV